MPLQKTSIASMKKISVVFLFILTLFSVKNAKAQSQFSGWLASFNTIKAGKKTSIHFDAQFRSSDEIKQFQTILLRPGINFHLKNNFILSGGYAAIFNRSSLFSPSQLITEHRIWEQLIYSHKIKTIAIQHRLRLEERFIPNVYFGVDGPFVGNRSFAGRARYFIRNVLPLKKQDKFTKGLFVALQDEIFLNVLSKDKVNGKTFDQNRLLLSTGYRISPKTDLEIGYLNQYVNGRGSNFVNNHVVQLACYLRL